MSNVKCKMANVKCKMKMRVAVLMTCYNRVEKTIECLRRLFAQKLPDARSFDVWLVDDASPDKTGDKVKATFPRVNVVQGTGNLFWCKGMHLAWKSAAAHCDYDGYFWLNDDTFLFDSAFETFAADAMACPDAILVGAVEDSEGKICYGLKDAGGYVVPNGKPAMVAGGMNGNAVLVPRSVFMRLGFIDSGYTHGFGDYDYADVARRAGIGTVLTSRTVGRCSFNPGYVGKTADLSLFARCKLLFSPKGFPLADCWHYRRKFHGTARALASCLHVVYVVLTGKR